MRVILGIREAFAEVISLETMTASVVNPLEAIALHERHEAEAALDRQRRELQAADDPTEAA